jgi:hypothetical protein
MLSTILLSVVMLSVVAPFEGEAGYFIDENLSYKFMRSYSQHFIFSITYE